LIESLRLRFALAESDEQLQRLVAGLLVPLLDKLDVATAPVRTKAIGLLGQINKKLRGRAAVSLPTPALLESTFGGSATAAGFSQGFRLMYVAMAMDSAADEHLVAAIPLLLGAVSSRPRSQQTILGAALLTAVLRAPELTEDQLRALGLADKPAQAEALVALARDLFLYHGAQHKADGAGRSVPDGLCESRLQLVTNDAKAPWTEGGQPLQALKLRLLHIVGSGVAFPADMAARVHELRLLALTCAGSDRYFQQVSDRGKDAVKRMCPVDAESPTFVQLAYASILGGPVDAGPENARTPVPAAVELKLLELLSRSVLAVASYDKWSRVVRTSVAGAKSPARLRQHGMAFLLWAIGNAPVAQLAPEAASLVRLIWDVVRHITAAGATPSASDLALRGTAYVALGALAKRLPDADLDRLGQLEAMFAAFATEPVDVRQSIQEGLLAMLPTVQAQTLPAASRQSLLRLLQAQLESPVYQAGYCALRYAIAAFPFSDMDARWLCILALASSKPGISKLAQSGLKIEPSALASSNGGGGADVPHPRDALLFLCEKASAVVSGSITRAGTLAGIANPHVYGGMLAFGRSVLLAAGATMAVGASDGPTVSAPDLDFINGTTALATPLQQSCMRRALADAPAAGWLEAVYAVLSATPLDEPALVAKALQYLVELLSLGPQALSAGLIARADRLLAQLDSRALDAQLHAARALSIVYGMRLLADVRAGSCAGDSFWDDQVPAQLRQFAAEAAAPVQPKLLDRQRGLAVALGSLFCGLHVAQRVSGRSWAELGLEPLGAALSTARSAVVDGLCRAGEAGTHPTVAVAWCTAAGEIVRLGGAADDGARVVEAASGLLKHAGNAQVYDGALALLSDIALGTPAMAPELISVLRQAAGAASSTQLDAHFRGGEALARALGRFECTLAQAAWAFPVEPAAVYGVDGVGANVPGLDALLEAITTGMARSAVKHERQAAAVWSLALVQSCPGVGALRPWLSPLHACLCTLLSDRSEQTQEVASRALGLIYNMADAALREDMVYSLISLFGGGRRGERRPGVDGDMASVQRALHQQIQSDEPLLEQESLGQTPDGHAVNTTYKSILSLASDMQNPALVYQFMQLATHAALWNSRCGAAYGVASIIEQAHDAVKPYLASMVPKLYRYTFDPSPQTRLAMKSIWSALVGPAAQQQQQQQDAPAGGAAAEPGIVARHWDAIIEECLASMSQREWKVRESGCSALASAVAGADPAMVVPYLGRIWQMAFRALDDIKASVREAALGTCQALATATVAWCTPRAEPSASREKQAQAVVDVVVPYLVDSGVGSDAEDVRGFSMRLLLRLCKVSGRHLSAFVPAIAERLLESLSNMETQAANYLTFHADSHGISQDQLESLRLSAVKSSPMMQGIETVLEYLQPESMAALVPRLQRLIRHGLGLPTRAGCARTVVVLCVKRAELVRPHASALVKAISGSLAENSALQRQAWAAAIGYMAPMLSPAMFRNLLKHLEKVYFEQYDDEARGVAAQVLEQLAQRCPERLCENTAGPGTAAFVLFGCSDAAESVGAAFRSAWREYMLGLGGKLVGTDVAGLLGCAAGRIADDNWARRVQGAKAVASVARTVEREARASGADDSLAPAAAAAALAALAQTALPSLMQATRGRPWPGKEHVLGAIVD
ncbi:proteasome component M29, partial [Coemansia helicoidea]